MKRKLRPYSLDADRISGDRHKIAHIDLDLSYENMSEYYGNFKQVKHDRKVLRHHRDIEKRNARHRMKTQLRRCHESN